MQLIPLEEAEKMLEEMKKQFTGKDDFQVGVTAGIEASIYKIKAVQIIDPIAEIDKMIEEKLYEYHMYRDRYDSVGAIDYKAMASEELGAHNALQELKSRLTSK